MSEPKLPQPSARLSLDAEMYADLMELLHSAESQARAMHSRQGDALAGTINKAIGLACLFEIEPADPLTEERRRNARFFRLVDGDASPRRLTAIECGGEAPPVYVDVTDRGLSVEPDADPRPLAQIIEIGLAKRRQTNRAIRAMERSRE